MWSYLFSFITAFIVTYLAIPSIIKVAEIKHLYDVPCDRKHHKTSVPTLGGMGIFAGLIFSLTFWTTQSEIIELHFIISALILLFFVGMKDDIIELTAWKKLVGQVMASVILVHYAEIKLNTFYGLFGISDIPVWASYALSIFSCVVITNAFNLIDGIDGLAASLGVVGAATFGTWFYFLGMTQYTILCLCLAGSLVAFLRYNITPAKIFMGDTGSMLIGFIMSLLALKFIESVRVLPREHDYKILSVPVFTCGVLVVPLFDTLRVFAVRLMNGHSPFKSDRKHIHYLLTDIGFSHLQATATLVLFNVSTIAILFWLQGIVRGEVLLLGLVSIPAGLSSYLTFLKNKKTKLATLYKVKSVS